MNYKEYIKSKIRQKEYYKKLELAYLYLFIGYIIMILILLVIDYLINKNVENSAVFEQFKMVGNMIVR